MTYAPQPIKAQPGQTYGKAKAQEDAQRVVPLPQVAGGGAGTPPVAPAPPGPPVTRPNIFGPTERPDEPLTAGAALGPGPSTYGQLPDDGLDMLRALVVNGQDQTGAVRRLLEFAARRG
jgi:hypothetical protein